MKWWKSKFASDRWKIQRIVWSGYSGVVWYSDLYMINQYSLKARRKRLNGEWNGESFPDNIYRG